MSELIDAISNEIAHLTVNVNPELEILLLMDHETEFEFYHDLQQTVHQPPYDEKGKRKPFMTAEIIVSRDMDGWRLIVPTFKKRKL